MEGTSSVVATMPTIDLSAVTTNFNSAIQVAIPVAVGIMAVMLGIKFIPKMIRAFKG